MRIKCILALVGVIALGAFLIKKFTNRLADGVKFQGGSIQWNSISISGVDITVQVKFSNDNPISIPITDFIGFLLYGSVRLAELRQVQAVTLQANSTTSIPINGRINFLDLTTDLVNVITTKQFKQDLRITGLLNVKGINADIDYPIIA